MSYTQADLDAIEDKIKNLEMASFSEGPIQVDTVRELEGLLKQRELIARSLRSSSGTLFARTARRGYTGNER